MSKNKKRHHNSSAAAKAQAREEIRADLKDRERKRMNPTARNLLLGNLVFLGACEWMAQKGLISDTVSGVCTILGVILLMAALYFQFGKGSRSGGSGGWPLLK